MINPSCRLFVVAVVTSLLFSAAVNAADTEALTVYRWERPDGTIEFSDEPRSGAEPVVVQQPMIAPSRGTALPKPPLRPTDDGGADYQLLSILKPLADSNYRNQQAEGVEVVGELKPALRPGHQVYLLVDGQVEGEGSRSATFTTGRLERGTHSLQLEVRGGAHLPLIQSEVVRIHVHRSVVRPADKGAGS